MWTQKNTILTRNTTLDSLRPFYAGIHRSELSLFFCSSSLQVNPGSKASQQGIREGELIASINGQTTDRVTNSQAHNLLKDAGSTLTLELTP